jgi:hypothetical protein
MVGLTAVLYVHFWGTERHIMHITGKDPKTSHRQKSHGFQPCGADRGYHDPKNKISMGTTMTNESPRSSCHSASSRNEEVFMLTTGAVHFTCEPGAVHFTCEPGAVHFTCEPGAVHFTLATLRPSFQFHNIYQWLVAHICTVRP